MHETRIGLHLEHKCGSDFNLSYIAAIMSRRKYFYNLWIRVDGVRSLFLKLYTITDTKGRRSGIVSAKYRQTTTAQNDGKMCIQCSELTETYRDEEVHPRYHVYYNAPINVNSVWGGVRAGGGDLTTESIPRLGHLINIPPPWSGNLIKSDQVTQFQLGFYIRPRN